MSNIRLASTLWIKPRENTGRNFATLSKIAASALCVNGDEDMSPRFHLALKIMELNPRKI
jgi:hypothetical protein